MPDTPRCPQLGNTPGQWQLPKFVSESRPTLRTLMIAGPIRPGKKEGETKVSPL